MRALVNRHATRGSFRGAFSVVLIALVFICVPTIKQLSARPFITTTEDEESKKPGKNFGTDINISAILDSLCVNYDKRIRPNHGGPPVDVGVSMHILSISSLSEMDMDFTVDLYFRQFWVDPRLAFEKQDGIDTLSVGSEFIEDIWVPDTFFVNEKKSYFHVATSSNEFIRIHHTGFITRSIRMTITAACPMDLQYFPMDRQLCKIDMESFGHTTQDIRYKWHDGRNSVSISPEVSLPQFKVLGHRHRATDIFRTTGNYSRLTCEFQFERSMGFYMIQIYIPSGLIVVTSWVSFWLNRNATPARVSLGVTTVLTMTTLISSINATLPKISYIKSLDVYLGTCFIMVFASLLEYAIVGYMTKRIALRKKPYMAMLKKKKRAIIKAEIRLSLGIAGPSTAGPGTSRSRLPAYRPRVPRHGTLETAFNGSQPTVVVPKPSLLYDEESDLIQILKGLNTIFGLTPADVDKYSRIVFPVCFLTFNLTYWTIYSQLSNEIAVDLIPFKGGN